jgi:hypothetical protein
MDDKKRKRLAALKQETAEKTQEITKRPRKQKVKRDIWGDPIVKRTIVDSDLWSGPFKIISQPAAPTPIPAQPTAPKAIETTAPEPKLIRQPERIPLPVERVKIYRWSDGYYLASGKPINAYDPEYADGERFKIFHPPNLWIANTEDGTAREYEITVELDVWCS